MQCILHYAYFSVDMMQAHIPCTEKQIYSSPNTEMHPEENQSVDIRGNHFPRPPVNRMKAKRLTRHMYMRQETGPKWSRGGYTTKQN